MYNIDVFTGLKWKLFSYYQLFNIKGLVHPNIIFVSWITHPHVVPYP